MGYAEEIARQSAWQFMRTDDPRISMLQKVAEAMEIPMEELVHPVRRGLGLILTSLNMFSRLGKRAKQTNDATKMSEYVDLVFERCRVYQKCCAEYFPEPNLTPYFKELEQISKLPTESDAEKRRFISKADVSLSRLHLKIQELL